MALVTATPLFEAMSQAIVKVRLRPIQLVLVQNGVLQGLPQHE
jgi:hypothetical protein